MKREFYRFSKKKYLNVKFHENSCSVMKHEFYRQIFKEKVLKCEISRKFVQCNET